MAPRSETGTRPAICFRLGTRAARIPHIPAHETQIHGVVALQVGKLLRSVLAFLPPA
jgi:hypothetical protein